MDTENEEKLATETEEKLVEETVLSEGVEVNESVPEGEKSDKTESVPEISEKEAESEESKEKKSHSSRNLGILLLLIALLYGGISFYFSSHFFFRTTILGYDCSFKTVDELRPVISKNIDDYSITLEERNDLTEMITSGDIGLTLADDDSLEECLHDQRCYTWIRCLWMHFNYNDQVNVTLDQTKYESTLKALSAEQTQNIVEPEDAYAEYNPDSKEFEIVPEVFGTRIRNDIFKKTLKKAILSMNKTFNLERNKCYESPKIYGDNKKLLKCKDALNVYMLTEITYDFGDRTEVVGPDVVNKWLSVDENYKVTLDEKKVKEYVKNLAKKYDTVGTTREFTSIAGNKVKVSGGTYGWKIDQDAEYKELLSLVEKHEKKERTPEYKHIAKSRDTFDIGDTYVEVDLSKQHMWFYKNGKTLVSTDVVTGDVSKGRGTPTGVYYIVSKKTDYVLTGQGYANRVDYWMPFIDERGIGIHDASWRSSFGGGIYDGNGSHGCVNTPHDAVKKIFNNISTTYPVVVHN